MKFDNILIWPKKNSPEVGEFSQKLAQWLKSRGKCSLILNDYNLLEKKNIRPDLIVSLGGDGTILGLARFFSGKHIPIFGINFGHVGYLCNSDTTHWQTDLEHVLSDQISVFACLILCWSLQRNGSIVAKGIAANDVVLSRATLARLISVDISLEQFHLGVLRGDGFICCSPLGSSGYNISAGGSILQPDLDVFQFTPICPFITKIPPLIFNGRTKLGFRILSNSADCFITIDGQEGQKLQNNDVIYIYGWPNALVFLGEPFQFYRRLARRGFVLEGKTQASAT